MSHPNTPSYSRVLRWTVLVNDLPQQIGGGDVLLVACRDYSTVEVWTLEALPEEWPHQPEVTPKRSVLAVGTGHPVPTNAKHLGSTLAADGALVWHVFDVTREQIEAALREGACDRRRGLRP